MASGSAKWKKYNIKTHGKHTKAGKRLSKLDKALTPRGKKVVTIKGGDTAPF